MNDKETLYGRLSEYRSSDYYPFHMPGHKRNVGKLSELSENSAFSINEYSPYSYDITEIEGFDNLHSPEDIIKKRMEEVSEFYESEKSYFLVNGSTCGILSAISALCENGKKIVMARNSHKAAYNALFLTRAEVVYIYPDIIQQYGINGGINPKDVEKALISNKDVGIVYITSPTYEGVVSDILAISNICHRYNVPLVVDEAHGAHFSMHRKFPVSALELGADIVIQSLHKTLPSLTQTAILHIGKNSLVKKEAVEKYLAIYQTSSPSYVLMASIDNCMQMVMKDTFVPFEMFAGRIDDFLQKTKRFTNIYFMNKNIVGKNNIYDFDISKLVIFANSQEYTGKKLYNRLLEKYHLQMEMASEKYVIAMTSIMDTDEGFNRLFLALDEIDREIRIYERPAITVKGERASFIEISDFIQPVVCKKTSEAAQMDKENIDIDYIDGRISGEFIYLYPPGIPLIAPGELFTKEIVEYIKRSKVCGLNVVGLKKDMKASVIRENWSSLNLKRVYIKTNY